MNGIQKMRGMRARRPPAPVDIFVRACLSPLITSLDDRFDADDETNQPG